MKGLAEKWEKLATEGQQTEAILRNLEQLGVSRKLIEQAQNMR
jgi:hypothetical protein